jgi:hypothetical protein
VKVDATASVRLAGSQTDGGPISNAGSLTCVYVFNAAFAPVVCP